MKINYIIIPFIAILVSISGSSFTQIGLKRWYKKLKLPDFAPDGNFTGTVWTVIYVLSTVSALIVWNSNSILHDDPLFIFITAFFLLNAVMNVFWSFLFFILHYIGMAAVGSVALGLSVLALIIYIYPISSLASALLLPYFIWVGFVTYLNYRIWELNK